jgi:hypothetical protein
LHGGKAGEDGFLNHPGSRSSRACAGS